MSEIEDDVGVDEVIEDVTIDFDSIEPPILPIDKEFHIFISYKSVSPDRNVAIKIDKLLRSRGYKCCLHKRDFLPGELIVNNIYKEIERSLKVLFLLSKNSESSNWCTFELNVTEKIYIQEKGYKPIILKLDDCGVPDTLKRYTYLPASSPPDTWISKVALAINNQQGKSIFCNKHIFHFIPIIIFKYITEEN